MKEIGSEFWNIPVCNKENTLFGNNTQWFLSGRTAIKFVIEDILSARPISTVALPAWCCYSMVQPFVDCGIGIITYDVGIKNGTFYQDYSNATRADAILLLDYFGFSGYSGVPNDYQGITIRDVTHSLLSIFPKDADYYCGSFRKWAAFSTGGFAWPQENWNKATQVAPYDEKYVMLRARAFQKKKKYIEGETEDKSYLDDFQAANSLLPLLPVLGASEVDITSAVHFDTVFCSARRRQNAGILLDSLGEYSLFKTLKSDDCPLFLPIIVPDGKRDLLQKWMIERGIFCPYHWPLPNMEGISENAMRLYKNELSLVCDQRYESDDMWRIIEAIKGFGL